MRAGFRSEQQVCVVLSLVRYRESLVGKVTVHLQHMRKTPDQMNLQLHHVISDLSGTARAAFLDMILCGEQYPRKPTRLHRGCMQATETTIATSLVKDCRREHLLTLGQSVLVYSRHQELMATCNTEIEQTLSEFSSAAKGGAKLLLPSAKRRRKSRHNPGIRWAVLYGITFSLTNRPYNIRRNLDVN
ncbi:MAG TPA: hypothetical protein VFU48_15955 [Nitrospira sp.]|nr:hypothetical protein [Nitrospira sp.]